jgi:hypothetical protein
LRDRSLLQKPARYRGEEAVDDSESEQEEMEEDRNEAFGAEELVVLNDLAYDNYDSILEREVSINMGREPDDVQSNAEQLEPILSTTPEPTVEVPTPRPQPFSTLSVWKTVGEVSAAADEDHVCDRLNECCQFGEKSESTTHF